MWLIQILLPIHDNERRPFSPELFKKTTEELMGAFSGLTAYTRSPAEGLWRGDGPTTKDEIIVLEVMAPTAEHDWWKEYRHVLESRFRQQSVIVRAQRIELL